MFPLLFCSEDINYSFYLFQLTKMGFVILVTIVPNASARPERGRGF